MQIHTDTFIITSTKASFNKLLCQCARCSFKTRVVKSRSDRIGNSGQFRHSARLLIKTLADNKRLVLTLQYGSNLNRLQQGATLGYTRKGTVFATRSRPVNECVVTGGEGNQQVSYGGETYWVCCKGCLSMFEDNPEKVIAAYEARKAKERAKQQSQ